jgi:hypothetical protein
VELRIHHLRAFLADAGLGGVPRPENPQRKETQEFWDLKLEK